MDSSFERAMGNAIIGGLVLAMILGVSCGACGLWAVQKASGYRVRVEKVEVGGGDAK